MDTAELTNAERLVPAEIEEHLQKDPGISTFINVIRALVKLPVQTQIALEPYLSSRFEAYNGKDRIVYQKDIWPDFPHGEPHPATLLGRSFRFDKSEIEEALEDSYIHSGSAVGSLTRIAESPYAANLESIHLHYCRLGNQDLLRLVNSPYMSQLKDLDIGWNLIDEAGIIALANSPYMSCLQRLNIERIEQITRASIEAIAASPHLCSLVELKLQFTKIGNDGVALLANSTNVAHIEFLDLSYTEIGDSGARAIAESPYLSRVSTLKLMGNQIGSEGISALANSPHLNPTTLVLEGIPLSEASATAIATGHSFAQLKDLSVHSTQLGPEGTKILYQATSMPSLHTLTLHADDAILHAIAQLPCIPSLRELHCKGYSMTDDGAKALAASRHLGQLEQISIEEGNELTSTGQWALALSPYFSEQACCHLLNELYGEELEEEARFLGVPSNIPRHSDEYHLEILRRHRATTNDPMAQKDWDERLFATLRDLLSNPPDKHHFALILEFFARDRWRDEETKTMAIAYAEQHLEAWPDATRTTELYKWWYSCPYEEPAPEFRFFRALEMHGPDADEYLSDTDDDDEAFHGYSIEGLYESSAIRQLTHLKWSDNDLSFGRLHKLLSCPNLKQLTSLHLHDNYIENKDFNTLHKEYGIRLEHFGITKSTLRDNEIDFLLESPIFQGLTSLDISHNCIGAEGLARILASPTGMGLSSILLHHNRISREGAIALAASPVLSRIKNLDLSACNLDDEGAIALVTSPHFQTIEDVSFYINDVGSEAIEALATSPYTTNLRRLRTSHPLNAQAIESLARSRHLHQLKAIECCVEECTNDILTQFSSPNVVFQLEELTLYNSFLSHATKARPIISLETMKSLLTSPGLSRLRYINIPIEQVSWDALQYATTSPRMRELSLNGIAHHKHGDKGHIAIATSPYIQEKIKRICLQNLSQKTLRELCHAYDFPDDTDKKGLIDTYLRHSPDTTLD